jgi:hypothetical protein
MAVNASCATCDQPLENDHLSLDDGSEVQFAEVVRERSNLPNVVGKT